MENCKYESDIKRLLRILDGNGQKGFIREFEAYKQTQKDMSEDIARLAETSKANATAVSAFQKYQSSEELLAIEKEKHRRERRESRRFMIAQSIATIGILAMVLISMFLK